METTEYRFRALTDIWTGDVNGREKNLKNTGLLEDIKIFVVESINYERQLSENNSEF